MEFKRLDERPNIGKDKKLMNKFKDFEKLIEELKKKEIPLEIINSVNQDIEYINSFEGPNNALLKYIRKAQTHILKLIEKDLKLVVKNHYRNIWLAVGMAAFGLPIGVVFGTSLDNMGLLGIGLPIGMVIGMAVGSGLDKKAFEEGRQLDLEVK